MNRVEQRLMLLKYIASLGIKKPVNDSDVTEIRKELEKIRKYKDAAYKRMNEQQKAGHYRSAWHSSQAYKVSCKAEKRLENILDGYEKLKNGQHYFTKDGANRYRPRRNPE